MKLATLPAAGRFIVDTLDAAYDVDLDAGIATRTDFADTCEARPDQTFMVERIECEVGGALVVDYWLGLADDDEGTHTSSTVLGITPTSVEVPA